MRLRLVQVLIGLLAVLSTVGCQNVVHRDYAAFVREPKPDVVGQSYAVGVPDVLEVTRVTADGLEHSLHTLGPDGKLLIPQLGSVDAAGLSCSQINQQANQLAQAHDAVSDVTVRVQTFASQKIFVFGQVDRSGSQAFHGANTVLSAIAHAQPNVRADVTQVQVLRPSPDGTMRRKLTVDVDKMIRQGDTTLDVVLAEGDVVFVPPTTLGSIGLAFEQVFPPKQTVSVNTAPAPVVVQVAAPEPNATPTPETPSTATLDEQTQQQFAALEASLAALTQELEAMRLASADRNAFAADSSDETVVFLSDEVSGQAHTADDSSVSMADSANQTDTPPAETGAHRQDASASVGVAVDESDFYDVSLPLNDEAVQDTADVQRGGEGEGLRPEGVRFWGP